MKLSGIPFKKDLTANFNEKGILQNSKVGIIPNPFDEASVVYYKNIKKTFEKFSIEIIEAKFNEKTTKEDYIKQIMQWNNDQNIDAIFIQVPLINNIIKEDVLDTIVPEKDLEGVTKLNLARIMYKDETIVPPTARAIIELAEYHGVDFSGKNVVVINRSYIIGKPLIPLLLNRDATPIICHSKTKNLSTLIEDSDIIITGVGKAGFLNDKLVKKNKTILDASINFNENGMCGDTDYNNLIESNDITPVPGGIGPVTNLMLIKNLCNILEKKNGII